MCGLKTPSHKAPEAVVYAEPPAGPAEPPKLKDPKEKNPETANIRANRRGTRALRTDLSIPSANGSAVGLQIPK